MTASEKILQKALAASNIDSKRWNEIQAGLRDRAFFSSKVESARVLHAARELSAQVASGDLSLSDFRLKMRHALYLDNYDPGDRRGTIQDLLTEKRLDLIAKTNVAQARGYVQHLQATNEGALLAYPCYELVRVAQRKQPRDWAARWRDAGGRFFGGRMIATKTDPIWTRISAFGNPFPPFDWGSGMGLDEVDYAEAVKLGVIERGQKIEPPKIDFNGKLEATVPFKGHGDPEWQWLKDAFGDQVVYKGDAILWKGEIMQGVARGEGSVRLGKSTDRLLSHFSGLDREHLENTSLSITGEWVEQHASKHIGENEKDKRNIPLTPGDFELIPSLWRNPDSVIPGNYPGSSVLTMETFDGGILNLAIDHRSGAMPLSFFKQKMSAGR